MDAVVLSLLRRAVNVVGPVIASVGPSEGALPTPCPELDVGRLVGHVIGGLSAFADVAEGRPLVIDADPDLATTDAAAAFHAAAERVLAAFGVPGRLEASFSMPWGATTGAQLVGFELIEVLVHGWDIARSVDRWPRYEDDLVTAALDGARQWVDDSTRVPQLFGPEVKVPADAPVIDRLVGFLGRNPAWSPPLEVPAGEVVPG